VSARRQCSLQRYHANANPKIIRFPAGSLEHTVQYICIEYSYLILLICYASILINRCFRPRRAVQDMCPPWQCPMSQGPLWVPPQRVSGIDTVSATHQGSGFLFQLPSATLIRHQARHAPPKLGPPDSGGQMPVVWRLTVGSWRGCCGLSARAIANSLCGSPCDP